MQLSFSGIKFDFLFSLDLSKWQLYSSYEHIFVPNGKFLEAKGSPVFKCTSATLLTPLSPSHQTQTFGVFVVLHTQPFLLCWWCQPLSPTCYTSVQVFYHFMPCCSFHSETSTFERAWLCKQSLTSAFLYHKACTIIKVIRQMVTWDHSLSWCSATPCSLVLPSVPIPALYPIIWVGCKYFAAGFIQPSL